ncbi:PfkB family carbohydrate kinase [Microbacterium sp.]|uniref:PfkB family carbohydrate kinase n=1 Tax=Microbacterium sp. TaxID=51671 RepID=UPI003A86F0A9
MTAQVLVIGEALIDIVDAGDGASEFVGGSPANVAVGLARHGVGATLLTRIGRDDRGIRIAEHLASSGAALATESWTDEPTSTARAVLQPDGSAEYVFDIAWTVPDTAVVADVVHTGSIALFLAPGAAAVVDRLARASRAGSMVTVDPNIRPALVGDHVAAQERFAAAAAAADLVKLSDEDAAWLYPDLSPTDVLARVAAHGPRVVVMTRGGAGALGLGPEGLVEAEAWPVTVADTIGAGDAYMSSLIASALDDPQLLTSGEALARTMRRAAVAAGITVSRSGANPPTRAEVDAAL